MWIVWAYIGGVAAVILGVLAWGALTVEVTPAHSSRPPTALERGRRAVKGLLRRKPLSRRQRARKEARRREWAARVKRARALLRRRPRPQKSRVIEARAVEADEPGEDWATDLAAQIRADEAEDPDAHLRRQWSEGKETGVWERDMLGKMEQDGQMPPPPLNRTEEWLARTEEAGEEPDSFMGREPVKDPEDD